MTDNTDNSSSNTTTNENETTTSTSTTSTTETTTNNNNVNNNTNNNENTTTTTTTNNIQQQQQPPQVQSSLFVPTPIHTIDIEKELLKSVPDLTEGLLLMTKIPLDAITLKLLELQKEQQILLSLVANENLKLQSVKDVDIIIENITEYLVKIQSLKKDMNNVQERVVKMKKRAGALREKKQLHLVSLNERVEKALQRERDMMAKPTAQLLVQQQQQQNQKARQPLNTNVNL
ncbi:hypothetical protein DFA_09925 [Cavenderia fasciculata]|uniref:Biogenesis of lysosome-related organelles complex 1 subunit 6 n=1 Tax=Cavenderia fasciculata TaxID=261658 RepID=F4Q8T2_CACFS|nr:uncharacterized protein DFA_09925 [Cavenderia fasciculata]EGG15101.1 hypothetical protein DFA_09925 [Cavenderia fasciculata]|eukprot:XP_004351821.1 hypothetical protein DFA_09925 [Cavenderia fasciculata]